MNLEHGFDTPEKSLLEEKETAVIQLRSMLQTVGMDGGTMARGELNRLIAAIQTDQLLPKEAIKQAGDIIERSPSTTN